MDRTHRDHEVAYASRGGVKLEHALTTFAISVRGSIVLDVGSSTGGFVDCLLQNGAAKVYSVDTAYGELAWKLRTDPRVAVMERTNILHLSSLPEEADLVTIDASWTKLELILPVIKKFLKSDGKVVALLKPHYEAPKSYLEKGVLADHKVEEVVHETIAKVEQEGWKVAGQTESPILGGGGNREFLVLLQYED